MAKFDKVIECLNKGGSAWRGEWCAKGENKEIVPKMTSLPDAIKPKVSTVGNGEIAYHDQVLQIIFTDDEKTPASATYFIPTWEDIFAEDWVVLMPAVEF